MALNLRAKIYLALVIILGITIFFINFPKFELTKESLLTLALLSTIAFFTEIYEVEIIYRRSTSTSTAIYTAAILLNNSIALWVALFALIGSEILVRWEYISQKQILSFLSRLGFNTSQVLISVAVASGVFKLAGGHAPPFTHAVDFVPPIVAFLAYTITNTVLVSGIIALVRDVSIFYHLRFNLKHLPVQLFSMGILSILIAIVYSISPWNIILLLVPLVLVHISLRQYMRLRKDAKDSFKKINDLLELRDPYTAKHSEQVATISEKIARKMGLLEERVERIKSAARIHDIGKIGIPDEILLKPSNLNDEE